MLRAALPRSFARQPAVLLARRFASADVAPPHKHRSPAEQNPPLPPGTEVDPQLHGYPQLPYVSLQHREPFGWWDRQERKNFEEVVHEDEDALNMWSPDVHKISGGNALLAIIAAFTALGGFAYFLTATRLQPQAAKRSYPYDGLVKELGGANAARVEPVDLDDE